MEFQASLYWTPGLLDRLRETLGYDFEPFLPLIFSPSNTFGGRGTPIYNETYGFGTDEDVTDSPYNLDYRNVLNDGYQDYLTHFVEWAHSRGPEYSAQPAYNLPLQMVSRARHSVSRH